MSSWEVWGSLTSADNVVIDLAAGRRPVNQDHQMPAGGSENRPSSAVLNISPVIPSIYAGSVMFILGVPPRGCNRIDSILR